VRVEECADGGESENSREKLTDLHAATKTEDEMESRLLLDVVVGQGATVLELLAGEDQALLVRGDALLVLDLALDVIDGIGGLDLEGVGLASDCEADVSMRKIEEGGGNEE
jgi:hypothetical protein